MTPQIKQRIEQNRRGEVPEDYKKTEAGFVPMEWTIMPLGDIISERNETNLSHLPLLSITSSKGVVPRSEIESKDNSSEDKSKYKHICAGDIGYNTMRMWQGVSALSSLDGIVSPAYTVLTPGKTISAKYCSYLFKLQSMINLFYRHSQGLVDDTRSLKYEWFRIIRVALPPLPEQKKIAEILKTQDRVIDLYEKKIEQLKKLKKVFLQKMFPKPGATVPEWRFPGFTATWEQRKLSSLCEKFTDGDWIESKDQSDSGVRLVQTGNVSVAEYLDKPNNKKWISADTFERLHCEEVLPGDILISRLPEPAGRACIMPFLGTKMITAVDCTIVRTTSDVSNKFLVQYLSSQPYFDEVNTCLAGGTRQRISRSNLAEFSVPIPSKKSEQDAIGTLFGNLDNLITLHQRKCDEEKQKKKALMQLLLTGIVRAV